MSIKKQYLKSKDLYKVTWSIDKKTANGAKDINLSGSFNDWSLNEHPMEKLKNGGFKIVMELPKDSHYQFRYVVDQTKWINEADADSFVDNELSNEQNCVVSLNS